MIFGMEQNPVARPWVAALGVLMAGSLAGCSNPPPLDESSLADLSLLGASAQRTMLIVTRAENVYIQECMNEAGFEFYTVDAGADIPVENQFLTMFVGEITVESAAATGYAPYVDSPLFGAQASAEEDEAETPHTLLTAYLDNLSLADQEAWEIAFNGGPDADYTVLADGTGIPSEGCLAYSMEELLGEQTFDFVLLSNGIQQLVGGLNLEDDADFAAAAASWRSCMAEEGYGFESVPEAIFAGVALRGNEVKATEEEITQAVVDAECQVEADLLGVTMHAFDREQRRLIDENLALILAWSELEDILLARSSEVLGFTYDPILSGSA